MTTKDYIKELGREAQKERIRAIATDDKAERRTHLGNAKKKLELRNKLLNLWSGGVNRAVRCDCMKVL